jgi:anaphase-promoting complex subunit 3
MMEIALVQLVQHYLSLHEYSTAVFYGERLFEHAPSDANAHVLATAYVASCQFSSVVHLLGGSQLPSNRFLFARACLALGRHAEAEDALLSRVHRGRDLRASVRADTSRVPCGAAGIALLADVYRAMSRLDDAADMYAVALEVDPYLWRAFTALAQVGGGEAATAGVDLFAPTTGALMASHPANASLLPLLHLPSADGRAECEGEGPRARVEAGHAPPPVGRHAQAGGGRDGAAATPATPATRLAASLGRIGLTSAVQPARGMGEALRFTTPGVGEGSGGEGPPSVAREWGAVESNVGPERTTGPSGGGHPTSAPVFTPAPLLGVGRALSFQSGPIVSLSGLAAGHPAFASALRGSGARLRHGPENFPGVDYSPVAWEHPERGEGSALGSAFATPGGVAARRQARSDDEGEGVASSLSLSRIVAGDEEGGDGLLLGGASVAYSPAVGHGGAPLPPPSAGRARARGGAVAAGIASKRGPPSPSPGTVAPLGKGPRGLARPASAASVLLSSPGRAGRTLKRNFAATEGGREVEGATLGALLEKGAGGLLAILTTLARATAALARCDSAAVLAALALLPAAHASSPLVHCLAGRAYAEAGRFGLARASFMAMRAADPTRVEGCDAYSTALWQLRRSVELTALAQELVVCAPGASATHVVAGNAASLLKDRPAAVRAFTRAAAADSTSAYPLCLLGLELLSSGKADRAAEALRAALSREPASYRAWHGMGLVLLRQDDKTGALTHFTRACALNQRSATLQAYLGACLFGLGRVEEAGSALEKARALDPGNAFVTYNLAQVRLSQNDLEGARVALLACHEASPRELGVLVQLGRVCKRLGRVPEAVRLLNTALELARGAVVPVNGGAPGPHLGAQVTRDKEVNAIKALLYSVESTEDDVEWQG